MNWLAFVVAPVLFTGCALSGWHEQHKTATAGRIGCPESEITVSEYDVSMSSNSGTWKATCRGQTFMCSKWGMEMSCRPLIGSSPAVTTAKSTEAQVVPSPDPTTCVPAADASAAATSASDAGPSDSGCQYDTQCKGERICRNHECVDP